MTEEEREQEEYEKKIEYNRRKHPFLYKIRKNIKRWITGFLIAFFAALLFSHYMFRIHSTAYLISLVFSIVFAVACVICLVIFFCSTILESLEEGERYVKRNGIKWYQEKKTNLSNCHMK